MKRSCPPTSRLCHSSDVRDTRRVRQRVANANGTMFSLVVRSEAGVQTNGDVWNATLLPTVAATPPTTATTLAAASDKDKLTAQALNYGQIETQKMTDISIRNTFQFKTPGPLPMRRPLSGIQSVHLMSAATTHLISY